ncbi:unannotated protein [freshwater metagenome]|uniref:Unannotated protein n=1 Tax=freshwater metagenome TaxID=449393 RepID=A0A6J6ELA6_9ZZZZ
MSPALASLMSLPLSSTGPRMNFAVFVSSHVTSGSSAGAEFTVCDASEPQVKARNLDSSSGVIQFRSEPFDGAMDGVLGRFGS